ncbi:terminal protein [Streptomyces capillispiralis]|nr:terminal protein [Streptomyces capillispiralis]GHE24182.1 hypothetical protein GCM10017779_71590 [Streptomyces capillispiralis]
MVLVVADDVVEVAEMYFRAGNTRAAGLGVEFTDVEHIEIQL